MNGARRCLFSWCFNWGSWDGDWLLFLWLSDLNNIWVWSLWSDLSSWIVWQHDFDLETDNTLSEEDVTDGGVDVFGDWVTGVDHKTVSELHGLSSLTSKFTRDDDFATLKYKYGHPHIPFRTQSSKSRVANNNNNKLLPDPTMVPNTGMASY